MVSPLRASHSAFGSGPVELGVGETPLVLRSSSRRGASNSLEGAVYTAATGGAMDDPGGESLMVVSSGTRGASHEDDAALATRCDSYQTFLVEVSF